MDVDPQRCSYAFAAFDLDGTLLDEDGTVSAITAAGLRRLRSKQMSLFVVSGRSPYAVEVLALSLEVLDLFEPIMVLRDGDILWNWRTHSIKAIRTIPKTVVPALLAHGINDFVADTGRSLVASSRRAAVAHAFFHQRLRSSITVADTPPAAPVAEVTIYADPHDVVGALQGIDGCSFHRAAVGKRCGVVPSGSCKTAGLTQLMAGSYAEPTLARVVAFGDGSNDACLLGSVGAGVAMAISDPDTARSATIRLTGSLATYLNEEFPGGLVEAPRTGHPCRHQPFA